MSQGEKVPDGLSMLTALMRDRSEAAGGNRVYAQSLGVAPNTLWRWLNGRSNPLHEADSREKLASDTGLDVEELRVLGNVSIQDACRIILNAAVTADSAHAIDPIERDLQEGFPGMAVDLDPGELEIPGDF